MNSLRVAGAIDLGGHTLTIESGGLIMGGSSAIHNGTIVPGESSAGELVIHGNLVSNALLSSIADAPGHKATLVLNNLSSGVLTTSNTYSGATIINGGRVIVTRSDALPHGTDLDLNLATSNNGGNGRVLSASMPDLISQGRYRQSWPARAA